MKIGYARVSTKDQTLDLQMDALEKAGCAKVFTEIMSGAHSERPTLNRPQPNIDSGGEFISCG
jgi:DNA invertase Pin-like site-specific DNA recombinase